MIIGVYGAAGCGREVLPLVRQAHPDHDVVFVDDGHPMVKQERVFAYTDFIGDGDVFGIVIAIADSTIRRRLSNKLAADGIAELSVRAASAQVLETVAIGHGHILCNNTIVNSDTTIGRGFHANLNSYVAHDCVIGDFVTFAQNVACNGNIWIDDDVYVGTGAIFRQGVPGKPLKIGKGAVIGMGAVVTRDVAAGDTVIGNPARPMVR